MAIETRVRTVTLFLAGGHLVKLGGVVDVPALVNFVRAPNEQDNVIEIGSGETERLILRRDALLAVMESYGANEGTASEACTVNPFVWKREFLSPEDHQRVIMRVLERKKDFEPSKVTTDLPDRRSSVLLMDDDVIGPMFRCRIQSAVPEVARSLGLMFDEVPEFDEIECQVTAHRDGGFYRPHNDSGSTGATATRVLTYVYYFQTRRHAFYGGELKLYQTLIENGADVTGEEFHLVKPEDNSILFFPSDVLHEILPTHVNSKAFADSRFTVNGWIRRRSMA